MTSNNQTLKWDSSVIPYTVDSSFDEDSIQVLRAAMAEFEKHTCLTFQLLDKNNTDHWPEDYLVFQNLTGCASSIGKQGGPQTISIQIPYCAYRGIVMHEIFHSLGFMHEHNRPDRDDYIRINWTNVAPEMVSHLQKYSQAEANLLGEAYDYSSILHGSSSLFAIDPDYPVLIPYPDDTVVIGQRMFLSESDIRRLRTFYCPSTPSTTNPTETTTAISVVCDGTTQYIPDPTDCSKFYVCTNNIPHLQSCPPNLLFNSLLHVCDWPRNVNCTSTS